MDSRIRTLLVGPLTAWPTIKVEERAILHNTARRTIADAIAFYDVEWI
jgi:hypothetical protein